MDSKLIFVTAAAMVAVGCTPVDHGFGETHRWNIEQQVIDPDPQYAGDPMEGGDGERAADAVTRYKEGTVKQPAAVTTTAEIQGQTGSGGPQ